MTTHAELLKEAWDLAGRLDYRNTGADVTTQGAANTLRTLVDLVEGLDMCLDECNKSIAELVNTVEQRNAIIIEMTAACVTCDENIGAFVGEYPSKTLSEFNTGWDELHAARHLARRAAKLAEPNMLTPPGYAEFRDRAKTLMETTSELNKEEALAMIDTECGEQSLPVVLMHANREAARIIEKQIKDLPFGNLPSASIALGRCLDEILRMPEPPPTEVAMRVVSAPNGRWKWHGCFGGEWVTVSEEDGRSCLTQSSAREAGELRLAALSDRLGVPLVAVWKDGE